MSADSLVNFGVGFSGQSRDEVDLAGGVDLRDTLFDDVRDRLALTLVSADEFHRGILKDELSLEA